MNAIEFASEPHSGAETHVVNEPSERMEPRRNALSHLK
jgi:hypothetical protein